MADQPPGKFTSITTAPPAYQSEAVRQLYLVYERAMPAMPLVTGAFVWGMWGHVDTVSLLVWFAAWLATTPIWLGLLIRHYRTPTKAPEQASRWGRNMTWMSAVEGTLWGIAGILFFVPNALLPQLLLLSIIVGKQAGSIFATSWWPPAFYVNALASLLLTASGMLFRGSSEEIGLAVGLVAFMAVMHQVMRMAHASAMETITLRFERQDLIDQLSHEKDIAERANLAKSRFLAAASHDLRQPLHAMTLFVAAMEDRARYPETIEMVGNVQRCTTALESLLQTLLDISKIDAGVIEPQPEDFRLAPLVERLAAEFGPQAHATGLALAAQCPGAIVRSDPALVERILRNLIGNAIRYTPSGRIDIRCHAAESTIVIEVSDTGIGIPVDQQERVFDEFVQLGNPERDRTKGLGLGLAIVRRLAELLAAPVALESSPGCGSTFRITLPLGNQKAAVNQAPITETEPNSLQGTIVTIVDDEADVREGMRVLLEGWGCRVFAGEDAASIFTQASAAGSVPEIVLADYRLRGDTTGVEAINAVRAHFQRDIPAAIITGDTAPERLAEAQASGHLLLHKPLRPAKLRVLLQNLRRGAGRAT